MSQTETDILNDNERDNPADEEIGAALSLENPKSFFLFAGAGSGKTGSLKKVLENLAADIGDDLRRSGQKIAVIAYTNVACDEILRRVNNDLIFDVKTIHSFAWSLIEGRNHDIRKWLQEIRLPADLGEIEAKHAKGKPGTKAHQSRERLIVAKKKRLAELPDVHIFTYNPKGDNIGRDSLNHDEVISITSEFLKSKETFQKIVLSKYPFILIDESQDTLRPFMEALFDFEKKYKGKTALGLFGDTMQRIYGHGLADLADRIPDDWAKPEKVMNHRSRARIVKFANSIRADADGRNQTPRSDREGGHVCIFLAANKGTDRASIEECARNKMAEITSDPKWSNPEDIKTLTIEWHMAASRLGFANLFEPLDRVDSFKTRFRDGTLTSMRLFSECILPICEAHQAEDPFALMGVLRAHSPLLSKAVISARDSNELSGLKRTKAAVSELLTLFEDKADPTCYQLLKVVATTGLFEIPEVFLPFCSEDFDLDKDWEPIGDEQVDAWSAALRAQISEVVKYRDYTRDVSQYGTHQGVKGLEFQRVMVIADDESMRFKGLASYEKLLGAKDKTKIDLENEAIGKETSLDRTRRLLYVTCTRAKESLAVVVYSNDPKSVAEFMTEKSWVAQSELVLM